MNTPSILFVFLLLVTSFSITNQVPHFKYDYIKSTYNYYMNKVHYKIYLLLDNYSSYSFTVSLQEAHTRIASIPQSDRTTNHGTYSISINGVDDISSYLYEIPCALSEPPSLIEDDVDVSTFNLYAYQPRGYEHNIGIDFVLSLSLESKYNKDLSFIERLHATKLLQHKVITFESYDSNREWGYMYIGNYSYDSSKYLHTAKCVSCSDYWGVKLNSFAYVDPKSDRIINLFTMEESVYMKMESNVHDLILPKQYYHILTDALFDKYYKRGHCSNNGAKGTKCKCDSVRSFPSVLLSVDKYTLNLTRDVLFREDDNECTFIIKHSVSDDSEWLMGNGLWLRMNTQFDYDNKEITFYSNNIEIHNTVITGEHSYSTSKYMLYLDIIITVLCVCGIICVSYIKLK